MVRVRRFLEQWQMDARDLHRRLILAPAPRERALRQAQEMARHLTAGQRLDSFGCGASLGTGSSHHWTATGRRLWRGRACRLDFRAVRGLDFLLRRGPLPGGRRTAGQVGAERRTCSGGLDQPTLRREGQLLLCGVPGNRGGGMDGTGEQQQRRDLGSLPVPVAPGALRAAEGHLGQRAGA